MAAELDVVDLWALHDYLALHDLEIVRGQWLANSRVPVLFVRKRQPASSAPRAAAPARPLELEPGPVDSEDLKPAASDVCQCGHSRRLHEGGGYSLGHLECFAWDCECMAFDMAAVGAEGPSR